MRTWIALALLASSALAQPAPVVLPDAGLASASGNSNNYYPLAYNGMRYQQIFNQSDVGGPNLFNCIQLRAASGYGGSTYGGFMTDLEVRLGETTLDYLSMTRTYATNNPNPVVLLKRAWVLMPIILNSNPGNWAVTLPFDRPWPWPGQNHLCVELAVYRLSKSGGGGYQLDAVSGGAQARTTRIWALGDPNAATSSNLTNNNGLVMRLGYAPEGANIALFGNECPGSNQLPPRVWGKELPYLGQSMTIGLWDAPANAGALLAIGTQRGLWGGLPLPWDLKPGAPGCFINVAPILLVAAQADAAGSAAPTFVLPGDPSLAQAALYYQWLVIDPQANGLGLTASRGARAVLDTVR